jgi:hypothetical protein
MDATKPILEAFSHRAVLEVFEAINAKARAEGGSHGTFTKSEPRTRVYGLVALDGEPGNRQLVSQVPLVIPTDVGRSKHKRVVADRQVAHFEFAAPVRFGMFQERSIGCAWRTRRS